MEEGGFGPSLGWIGIERAGENVSVLSSLEEDRETFAGGQQLKEGGVSGPEARSCPAWSLSHNS